MLTIDIALPAAGYQTVESRQAFYQRAFAGVRALPDVQAVGAAICFTVGFGVSLFARILIAIDAPTLCPCPHCTPNEEIAE